MRKKENRGGAGRGQGRKPQDPAKKKHSRSVCLTEKAWERIDCRAATLGFSRSQLIQQWADSGDIYPSKDGEWVKWKDVQDMIEALKCAETEKIGWKDAVDHALTPIISMENAEPSHPTTDSNHIRGVTNMVANNGAGSDCPAATCSIIQKS